MNANLSAAQFGLPQAHGASLPTEQPPSDYSEASGPLPFTGETIGSISRAAVWRKPNRVLPLGKGTLGSVFRPFGDA